MEPSLFPRYSQLVLGEVSPKGITREGHSPGARASSCDSEGCNCNSNEVSDSDSVGGTREEDWFLEDIFIIYS